MPIIKILAAVVKLFVIVVVLFSLAPIFGVAVRENVAPLSVCAAVSFLIAQVQACEKSSDDKSTSENTSARKI